MQCPYKWNMVKQEVLEEKTSGGIILPEKARTKNAPARGEVICAGVENKYVKVGDKILFSKENAFTDAIPNPDFPDDITKAETYVFVKEEDICLVTGA